MGQFLFVVSMGKYGLTSTVLQLCVTVRRANLLEK